MNTKTGKVPSWFRAAVLAIVFLLPFLGESLVAHAQKMNPTPSEQGEALILNSWQGDYPVDMLYLLPENQRKQGVGFIDNATTFADIWKAFKATEEIPAIDFNTNLILFARNTQFFNRNRIGKVNVVDGIAEILAMETLSAMPIEDKVAMSMAVVERKGLKGLKAGDKTLPLKHEL